ncbi:hypothetical protein MBLNU457_4176t2 [Dothideomycetes sp. NU457]
MRLTTWNVNGIRNPFGYQPWSTLRTFPAMFDILEADIVVMQELKIQRKDLRDDMVLLDGWDCYFSLPKQKKGYSGVGIYTRNATCSPIRAEEGVLGVLPASGTTTAYRDLAPEHHIGGYPTEFQIEDLGVDPQVLDSEGRCVCLEFPAFVLFGVYSPANSSGLRDDFRYGFLCALDCRIRNLVALGKRVVLVGDLNVSRAEMDTASSLDDMRKMGITHDDYISTPNRRVFNQLIMGGDVVGERDVGRAQSLLWDITREFHPERKGMYTHWEQKINARPGNFGSRIDFVLINRDMKDWVMASDIQEGLMGSDHCPVYADFRDKVDNGRNDNEHDPVHLLDIMNPPGTFRDGVRQKPWSSKDIPGFSGKLMAEFDKRRSIKDMFTKPSRKVSESTTEKSGTNDTLTNLRTASTKAPEHDNRIQPSETASQTSTASPSKSQTTIKRGVSDITAPTPNKKQKQNSSVTSADHVAKGQQSLKGFFVPKSKPESPCASVCDRTGSDLALETNRQEDGRRNDENLAKAIAASCAESKAGTVGQDTQASDEDRLGT